MAFNIQLSKRDNHGVIDERPLTITTPSSAISSSRDPEVQAHAKLTHGDTAGIGHVQKLNPAALLLLTNTMDQLLRPLAKRVLMIGSEIVPMTFTTISQHWDQRPEEPYSSIAGAQIAIELPFLWPWRQHSMIVVARKSLQNFQSVSVTKLEAIGGPRPLMCLIVAHQPVSSSSALDGNLVPLDGQDRSCIRSCCNLQGFHTDSGKEHQHMLVAGDLLTDP